MGGELRMNERRKMAINVKMSLLLHGYTLHEKLCVAVQ